MNVRAKRRSADGELTLAGRAAGPARWLLNFLPQRHFDRNVKLGGSDGDAISLTSLRASRLKSCPFPGLSIEIGQVSTER